MKKSVLIFVIAGLLTASAFASTDGGFGGAYGRMGAGARAKALGNAYTGLGEGPSAIYFNPGALSFGETREFTANTSKMALDRRLDYIGFVAPLHPKAGPKKEIVNAGLGVGWLHAGVGNIDSRDFDGNPMPTIDQSSNLFLFAFGLQPDPHFGIGVTAKVIYETFGKIGNENRSVHGNGFAVDAGAFARPIQHLSVGLQVKDIGAKTAWNTSDYWAQGSTKTDQWPTQYRFGAAYERFGFTGAVDIEGSREGEVRPHAGLEGVHKITARQSLAGRIGYDNGSPTFGVGFDFAVWKVRSQLDLTYVLESVAPDNATTVGWSVRF